jgi:hypothetical protein
MEKAVKKGRDLDLTPLLITMILLMLIKHFCRLLIKFFDLIKFD